jgi:ssDNA-binding Zn-finger/Zn-ribbon topoisomerase 1
MAKCPECGKPFKVVAYGRDYKILGCPEHREFDRIIYLETRKEAEDVEP